MSHKKGYLFILILAGVISALAGIAGNVASNVLPPAWRPYLWLAWPLLGLFVLASVALAFWQRRLEERSPAKAPEETPPAPAVASPVASPVLPRPSPPGGPPYDVFISYSHRDEAWVTGVLLPRLEAAGLRACIDFRDFTPGKAALLNMQDAVRDSRHTLLVLTPAWVESEWTLYESLLTGTRDPAGLRQRTVPLRLARCELPDFIAMLTWVDFTRPEREAMAWQQLLVALGAPPEPEAPPAPSRAAWRLQHPYGMAPHFTGRAGERALLSDWLAADAAHPLLVLRALGGFGKSALAWHWLLHDVDPARWPHVLWWGFYDEPDFESFVRQALAYLGDDPRPLSPRQQVEALLRRLAQPGVLLVLDGFERALRAYGSLSAAYQGDDPLPPPHAGEGRGGGRDCINLFAGLFLHDLACLPDLRGKALLTTRLRPRALEAHGGELLAGCREAELGQMSPPDAVAFWRAQGVRGARAELEAAAAPYGYHPLSLRLLAGLIVSHPRQPGDVAVTDELDVTGDLVQRQHHVLERAYGSLPPPAQRLLSRLACFRGPVGYQAVTAAAGEGGLATRPTLDANLSELLARGLLHRARDAARYDLHPIVRRYAYDRLTGAARRDAHGQLRDYFAALPPPERVQTLADLQLAVELYHHTVQAGQYDEARTLFRDRLHTPLYYQFGAYQLQIALLRGLFPDGEDKAPRLKDESAQAWTLAALANSYSLSGQPRRAVPLFEQQIAIREKQGAKRNLAVGLGNLAAQQMIIGALRAAESSLRRRIALGREIEDARSEAIGRQELGRLLAYRGVWAGAEAALAAALAAFEQLGHVQLQGVTWAYRALCALLLARSAALASPSLLPDGRGEGEAAPAAGGGVRAARRALELANETARTRYPVERDYVRAHWLLGAAHLAANDLAAERHLGEALTRCRRINAVDVEADILLDLARWQLAQAPPQSPPLRGGEAPQAQGGQAPRGEGEAPQAQGGLALRLAQEALTIAGRSGYVLQSADAHLLLAQLALAAGDEAAAREHARRARALAACDGPPDYTYRVAYDEAGALLERLEGTKNDP